MSIREVQLVLGSLAVLGAILLGLAGKEGWGWFILMAFLCIPGCVA